MSKTKECVACFKHIPEEATICPNCQQAQPGPNHEATHAKLERRVDRLRWVYAIGLVALVIFLGINLYNDKGGSKRSATQACQAAKDIGYGGSMKDCVEKMGESIPKKN